MVWQLITWPTQSLLWLARQIQERAETQLDQKQNLQKELTALQIQLDLGDIDEDTYAQREEQILLALADIAKAASETPETPETLETTEATPADLTLFVAETEGTESEDPR